MGSYEKLLEYIKANENSMFIAMLSILYFIIGDITSAELTDIMTRLGMSYNTSTNVLTDGETSYSIYDLIYYVVSTNAYKKSLVRDETYMKFNISTALDYGLITSEQSITLEGLL